MGKDFSEFLLVIGAIVTCVIAPVFAFFLHSIYKVPGPLHLSVKLLEQACVCVERCVYL